MSWYAAHVVMIFRLSQDEQQEFRAWENVVLIEADSSEQAWLRARQYGKQDESADGFHLEGKPVRVEFAGVRKVVACVDPDERPGDGTEVSYTDVEFASRNDLERYLAGEDVNVFVCDGLREDESSQSETESA